MITSAAIGAGDRWPVGCALLVAVLLSLLLGAILWILLWRLFGTEGVADFQQNIKRRLVIRPCFSAIDNGRRVAGVIHNQSQTGLTPGYLLRVRLRVLAARGALR
jgi:hypothetical protein